MKRETDRLYEGRVSQYTVRDFVRPKWLRQRLCKSEQMFVNGMVEVNRRAGENGFGRQKKGRSHFPQHNARDLGGEVGVERGRGR